MNQRGGLFVAPRFALTPYYVIVILKLFELSLLHSLLHLTAGIRILIRGLVSILFWD